MAKPGRNAKPVEQKKREGNPGKRPLNHSRPMFGADHARCPTWLPEFAKATWAKMAPELKEQGLLNTASAPLFAQFCYHYAEWRDAVLWIRDHGTYYVTRDRDGAIKDMKKAPQVMIAKDAANTCRLIANEFGLTPSAAGGIELPEDDGQADLFGDDAPAPVRGANVVDLADLAEKRQQKIASANS